MARLVITQNVTLDGKLEPMQDWFSPSGGDETTTDLEEKVREQMAGESALLLGRKTFQDFRGYWPLQTDDTSGVTAHLDAVPKYVLSSTITDPQWKNTTILTGDPVPAAEGLLRELDGEVGVTGSIRLTHALLAGGIVDEVRMFVYPVVLGTGTPLFVDGPPLRRVERVEVRPFRSGVTLVSYRFT